MTLPRVPEYSFHVVWAYVRRKEGCMRFRKLPVDTDHLATLPRPF